MKDWNDTQAPQGGGLRQIERVKLGDSPKVRLVGGVLPRYVYWLTTKEGKRMPVECLSFDRETEKFTEGADPVKEIPQEAFSGKPDFSYICNVIDRKDSSVKICDLKKTVYNQIIEYSNNPEYGIPSDPNKGYDVTIKRERTGPLPQNVKYTVIPSRNVVPLSEEEKEVELYDLDKIFKRPTYEEQKEWLLRNTTYFLTEMDEAFDPDESAEDLDG